MVTRDLMEWVRRAEKTRLVMTDVDGVLTDAGVYYSARGEEMKRFSLRDGMGVERLRNAGIAVAFITREHSPIVARRAEKLGIEHVLLGIKDKRPAVVDLGQKIGVAPGEMAYIGDDVNDLEAIELIAAEGLTAAPHDALPAVIEAVQYRCRAAGGQGAFRDFAEWILGLRHAASYAKGERT
jgi:3-deoxy-D-manno-octulosonate 8-phosphate phosphatase (KDO 8-P phosphatase)